MIAVSSAEVHLWCCRTDLGEAELANRETLLSLPELERAARFRDPSSRVTFVAARGWLRQVLAGYTGVAPRDLLFRATDFGKPMLVEQRGIPHVSFNLSHSGHLAIVAVAGGMPIGVDIERVRPVSLALAGESFAPGEVAALDALAPERRDEGFMRCWTRKEAYLKALGIGLDIPLDSFEVSLVPSEPAQLVAIHGAPQDAGRWQLAHLDPAPGYCGALAAPRRGWSWSWKARPDDASRAWKLQSRAAIAPVFP